MVLIMTALGALIGYPVGQAIRRSLDSVSVKIVPILGALFVLVIMGLSGFFACLVAQQVFSQPLH